MNRHHPDAVAVPRVSFFALTAALLSVAGCAAPVSSEPAADDTSEALVLRPFPFEPDMKHTVTGDDTIHDVFYDSPPLLGARIYEYDFKLDPFSIAVHSATITATSDPLRFFLGFPSSSFEEACRRRYFTMTVSRYNAGYYRKTPWGGRLWVEPTWVVIATESSTPAYSIHNDSQGHPSVGLCTVPDLQWTDVIQHQSAIRVAVVSSIDGPNEAVSDFFAGSVSYYGTSQ